MKLDDADLDLGYFQPVKRNVDRTIGVVLTGLFVVFLFLVFLGGILRVQDKNSLDMSDSTRTARKARADIGDTDSLAAESANSQSTSE